jgi:branched-chain amino acid transport system substrate-binding protein
MIGGLSGPDAADATAAEHGMEAATTALNAQGGILGHHVVLTVDNDQAQATQAASDLSSYLASGKTPNLVWPGSTSTEGLALAPTLTRDKILANGVVSAPSVVDPGKNPYFFNVTGPLLSQGVAEAAYFKDKGITRVGVLYENFIIGTEEEAAESAALKAAGISVTAVGYPPSGLNLTPEVQKLAASQVQGMLLDGLGQPVGLALSARASLGWTVPVLGDALTSGTFNPAGTSMANLSGVSWLVQQADVYTAHPSAAFTKFYRAVQKLGPIDVPLFEYAAGWDALMLADDAAVQSHSISAPAMAGALEHLRNPSPVNYVLGQDETYSPANHALSVPLAIVPMRPPLAGRYDVPSGTKP